MPADPCSVPYRPRCCGTWTAPWSTPRRSGTVSLQDTARELGGELSARARDALVGVDIDTSIVVLLGDLGVPATPERIAWTERPARSR